MSAKHVYATSDTMLSDGTPTRRGELWLADDPLVQQYPQAFTDDPEAAGLVRRSGPAPSSPSASAVETATAAPGERRTRTPRA